MRDGNMAPDPVTRLLEIVRDLNECHGCLAGARHSDVYRAELDECADVSGMLACDRWWRDSFVPDWERAGGDRRMSNG